MTKLLRVDKSLNDTVLGGAVSLEDDSFVPERVTASPDRNRLCTPEGQAQLWRFTLVE